MTRKPTPESSAIGANAFGALDASASRDAAIPLPNPSTGHLLVPKVLTARARAVSGERGAVLRWVFLAPLWDLWAFAIWMACYLSREVLWRGRRLSIGPDGKIEPVS